MTGRASQPIDNRLDFLRIMGMTVIVVMRMIMRMIVMVQSVVVFCEFSHVKKLPFIVTIYERIITDLHHFEKQIPPRGLPKRAKAGYHEAVRARNLSWHNCYVWGKIEPMTSQKISNELIENAAQKEAIRTIEGPLLIVSCPGSGKTTTLIRRIHEMIETGISPNRILMVTFTNAAAVDMQRKYQSMYRRNPGITFQTIHSLCFNLLRAEKRYDRGDLMTAQESRHFFLEKLKQYHWVSDPWELSKALMTEISAIRNNYINISAYTPVSCSNPAFTELYRSYADFKAQRHRIDFDDMLFECKSMLEYNAEILRKWQQVFQYIQCDEYQDTNLVQRDILYMLAGENGNLCVVGDDDQSIYEFRGADPSIMLHFKEDYPSAKVVMMGTNYRSALTIVQTAERLIEHNANRFQKQFVSERGEHQIYGNVIYLRCKSRKDEIDSMIKTIRELHEMGHPYREMAVLFRTNKQAQLPVMELSAAEIPYYSTEAIQSIYDGWIFGDLRAYASLALGIGSEDDIMRVLNHPMRYLRENSFRGAEFSYRGFRKAIEYLKYDEYWKYKAADEKIRDWMDALGPGALRWSDPPKKLFDSLIGYRSIHYDEYLANYAKFRNTDPKEFHDEIDELKTEALRFGTIREWFDYADDYERKLEADRQKNDQNGVTLTTMHKSKGLEWKTVFVIDVNRDLVPYEQNDDSPTDFEEERRLFYVSMTRAKDNLYLINSSKDESMFLKELQPEENGWSEADNAALVGKQVRHKSFGNGKILGIEKETIVIDFGGTPRRFLYPGAFEKGFLSFIDG